MIQLVQVRGQSPGLFPANLLPDCARMGFEVKTISEHATPGLEQIVLVDYADPLRSLAYIRRLREQGCCCFVLLVAPEEALPPFAELSGLGIAAFVPVPVQRDAVVSALEQAAVQVQTIRNHYIPRSDYVQLKQTLDTMYISRMYTMATSGRVQPPADLAAFNAIYGTKFDTERFACFGLQVDPGGLQASGREPAWPYLQDDAAAFFESHGLHAVQLRIAGFCGYLVTPGTQRMPALAGELYAVLRRAALPSDRLTVSYAGPMDGIPQVPELFQQTVESLRNRITLGAGQVIHPDACVFSDVPASRLFANDRLIKFCACIDVGDLAGLEQQLTLCIDTMRVTPPLPAKTIYTVAIRVFELLRNYGRQPAKGGIGENPDLRFHLDLDNCCSLDMLEQILLQWCRELLSPDGAPPQARNRIALSLQYIDDHLDQPLSLGELAQLTQLSPSYYSSLFKRQVGCTFCEYVQSRRISASIDLLVRTQMTVAEISRQVGFSDYRYFSRLFCRVTGMTPSHYRKENRVFPEEKT